MSTKFTEYKGLDLPTVASSTRFWKKENIFESNLAKEVLRLCFEGPPSANGLPEFPQ
jgi:isoleucyl-tRNA synthetase